MEYKFSVTINDKKSSLSPRKGLDIEDLGSLIQELKKAIDPQDNSFCSLYKISNHGYSPNFITTSKKQYENFIALHQNIYEKPLEDLRTRELKYAQTLKSILHKGRFLESFGMRSKPIATIYPAEINKPVDSYNSITTVIGIISEMGAPDFKKKTHIFLDGQDYKIYTNEAQDSILRLFYRTQPIALKIRQKISIKSNRVISASLLDIPEKSKGRLIENIKSLSQDDLSFISKTQTHRDILNIIGT